VEYIGLAAVVIGAFLLHTPRFRDPLDPDYGVHLYLAQTWRDGKRLYLDIPGGKPPGLNYLYMAVYRWWGRSPVAIRSFIAAYYCLTTVAVYFLSLSAWHNSPAALVSAGIFAMLTALPQYWSHRSQAENFMLLFETAALALYLWRGAGWGAAIAGMLVGAAFLFKPTALAQLCLPAIWSIFVRHNICSAATLAAGFSLIVLAPFIHFMQIGRVSSWLYFRYTLDFVQATGNFGSFFRRGLPGFKESVAARKHKVHKPRFGTYMRARYRSPITQDIRLMRERTGRLIRVTSWLLALVLIAMAAQRTEPGVLITSACIVAILVGTIQRAYFPSHFLPAAPTASVLAGWMVWRSVTAVSWNQPNAVGSVFILILAGLALSRMAASWYVISFVNSREDALVNTVGAWAERWMAGNEVAELFRSEIPRYEYVLQYGENSQVYYSSERRSASQNFTWVYPTPPESWQDLFATAVNERRPAMIACFERLLDMNAMQPRLEPVYRQKTLIRGQFPLYERVDQHIDRLRAAPVYLHSSTDRHGPTRLRDQDSPTGPFVSLIVIGPHADHAAVESLAQSLGEPVEIVAVTPVYEPDMTDPISTERNMKSLTVPDNLSPPTQANRGIQLARGDRLLFVTSENGLPDAHVCRAVIDALNADSRVGFSASGIAPAELPVAIRASAFFRLGHLDTSFETLSGALTVFAYRSCWVDYRCTQLSSDAPAKIIPLPARDEQLFLEQTFIPVQQFAVYFR